MNSINNFVEILMWEGENNCCSILYPITKGVQTFSGAFYGRSNTITKSKPFPRLAPHHYPQFHSCHQSSNLEHPLTMPTPLLRGLPVPGIPFCPLTPRRVIDMATTAAIPGVSKQPGPPLFGL